VGKLINGGIRMRDLTEEELRRAWSVIDARCMVSSISAYLLFNGNIYLTDALGIDVYDMNGSEVCDSIFDCGGWWKKAKPIPRKPFDISEHNLNKHLTELESGSLGVNDCGWIIDKECAIAIAKHFKLSEGDFE
jgi:hypothetical protein